MKVYPRHMPGRFRNLRNGISVTLQGLLFISPWLQWHGRQALLIDLPGRKLYMFGLVLHPQDNYFLLLLSMIAVVLISCVSALAGRMWCGFACPQTLFTQAFIRVERWFEGDRAARMRLDRARWSARKVRAKLGKWLVWTAMGVWLGLTFAGYFLPIRSLVGGMLHGQLDSGSALLVAILTGGCLFNFGYFREQFCWYICPYARLQGTMLDSDSLIVGYDALRGEPRGKVKDSERGSCVDCTLCVQVCPAGIDIRDGLQSECIACTACIDACDDVMDKIKQPRGLIRYTSLNGLENKPTQVLRPRLIIYLGALTGLVGLFFYLALTRTALAVEASRQVQPGGQIATTTPDGRLANVFRLHLTNRLAEPTTLWVELDGLPQAQMLGLSLPVQLQGGEVLEARVLVIAPATTTKGVHNFRFRAFSQGTEAVVSEATFFVP